MAWICVNWKDMNRRPIDRFDDQEEFINEINREIVKMRLYRLMFECERERRPPYERCVRHGFVGALGKLIYNVAGYLGHRSEDGRKETTI